VTGTTFWVISGVKTVKQCILLQFTRDVAYVIIHQLLALDDVWCLSALI